LEEEEEGWDKGGETRGRSLEVVTRKCPFFLVKKCQRAVGQGHIFPPFHTIPVEIWGILGGEWRGEEVEMKISFSGIFIE